MNKVSIVGRLTKDPEIRYSQGSSATAVARFTVAANRKFKRDGEPDADFISCVSFGKNAEFISKYFSKGKMIGINGSIRTGSWTDNTGQKRYTTEVAVDEAEFVDSKSTNSNQNNSDNTSNVFDPADTSNNKNNYSSNDTTSTNDFYDIEQDVDHDNLPF